MSPPPPDESSARRDELLDGAVAWTVEHGLADLSLRPLAKALGTSDRMLLYYFGTKDELVAAIVDRAADGLAAALELVLPELSRSPKAFVEGIWGLLADPAAQGVVDLFLELFVLTRRRGEPYRSASSRVIARWIELATPAMVAMGVPSRQAAGVVAATLAQLDGGILLAAAGASDVQLGAVRKAAVATIEGARS